MKHKLKTQYVLKIASILILLLLVNSCAIQRDSIVNKKHNIKKFKSKDYFTGVTINTYDDIDKNTLLPSTVIINNVYLEGNIFRLGLGKHNIKIIYPSMKSISIKNLKIELLDSIVIKEYLKGEMIID